MDDNFMANQVANLWRMSVGTPGGPWTCSGDDHGNRRADAAIILKTWDSWATMTSGVTFVMCLARGRSRSVPARTGFEQLADWLAVTPQSTAPLPRWVRR